MNELVFNRDPAFHHEQVLGDNGKKNLPLSRQKC